jgi:hypothetical protein
MEIDKSEEEFDLKNVKWRMLSILDAKEFKKAAQESTQTNYEFLAYGAMFESISPFDYALTYSKMLFNDPVDHYGLFDNGKLLGHMSFGICFGHQILGRALGFETYKLQFGHRGINQPVLDKRSGKVEITAHNHGFALKAPTDSGFSTVYGPGQVTHICLNDGVVEGIELLERGAFSVQYHPEAAAGPHDAAYLFDQFVDVMTKYPRTMVGK